MPRSSVIKVFTAKVTEYPWLTTFFKINFLSMSLKRMTVVLLALHVVVMIACNKDKSLEVQHDSPIGNGGGSTASGYGWAYIGNSANFKGCIDTAYTSTNQGAAILAIEGTDSANNAFLIAVGAPNGTLATGTFNETTGAGMIVTDQDGKTFISKTFSIKITNISSTEVTAEFSGAFSDDPASGNTTYIVTSGKLKAVIGADTPCL
jgi:hypothetical protein